MLENMYVSDTGEKSVTVSVRDIDYGKLRGAEEGIFTNRRDSKGRLIPKSKVLVKRPFFHLSNKDIEAIKSNPDFVKTFNRAIKRLSKD